MGTQVVQVLAKAGYRIRVAVRRPDLAGALRMLGSVGQIMPIQQNMALFSIIGTTYGGNGTSNFALPNLQAQAAMGAGAGPGLTPRVPGETDGSITAVVTSDQMPQHTHVYNAGKTTVAAEQTAIPGPTAYLVVEVSWLVEQRDVRRALDRATLLSKAGYTVQAAVAGQRIQDDARDLAVRHLGGEYEVLFNGIEVERFAGAEPWPTVGPTVMFLGRHEPRKGLDVLLAALPSLPGDTRIWISAATREVQAVTRLDGRPVGSGKPGPHWRAVFEELQRYKRELEGTPW